MKLKMQCFSESDLSPFMSVDRYLHRYTLANYFPYQTANYLGVRMKF